MPRPPSYIPRDMLEQPGAWDTDNPATKSGVEPRVATAVRLQQHLARQLDTYRRAYKLSKGDLAATLHISTAQLRRLADGHAPITLLQACAIANLLGLTGLDWSSQQAGAAHTPAGQKAKETPSA